MQVTEIYVDFSNHEHCRLFNKYTFSVYSDQYIENGVKEMLYDRTTGNILAEVYYNDFKVLQEHFGKYTKENLKTFKNISELEK